jgi:hypothetical protein
VQIVAPFDVQDVPVAAVPSVQEQVLDAQEVPLSWKPASQLVQILVLCVVQDAPVAATPPEQEQELDAQETLLK